MFWLNMQMKAPVSGWDKWCKKHEKTSDFRW